MAAAVATQSAAQGATLAPATPGVLFQAHTPFTLDRPQYDVTRDGRFLINAELETASAEPIHLLLNWKPRSKRYHERMGVGTLISVDEYLRTSFRPDCDFIEGEVLERNVGKRGNGYAQALDRSMLTLQRNAYLPSTTFSASVVNLGASPRPDLRRRRW